MKSLDHFAIGLLLVLLLISVALNYYLFNRGRAYYLQVNAVRLDPLGLDYYDVSSDQQDATNPDLTTVVFFGDSRAASWPAPSVDRFEFINRGIGSQTSVQTVSRLEYHVKPLRPQIIVVQVGINNLKTIPLFPEQKGAIIADCKEDIRQIVHESGKLGTTVILTTIFPFGQVPIERRPFWSDDVVLAVEEINAYIRSLEGERVRVFDAYSVLLGEGGAINPEYSRNLLHLNATGYKTLNKELERFLTAVGG
ncbi:MAG: SGNH/GDSL hydrolase family protein [Chloroflexi bacterium]|nr:SGNH/GDSL hydrolase family protein [Chloroflexota bacterium]